LHGRRKALGQSGNKKVTGTTDNLVEGQAEANHWNPLDLFKLLVYERFNWGCGH
jgi:hypothetical protein